MKVLELFSGTHSIGRVCKDRGYEVISLDRDLGGVSKLYDYDNTDNHIQEDIMTWDYKVYPSGIFDIITASPVCLWWSCMRRAVLPTERIQNDIDTFGKPMVDKVIEIIEYFKPKYYWIENPFTGGMKHYIKERHPNYYNNYVVDYCKYDDNIGYQKRTIFFTNIKGFTPKKCKKDCKNMSGNRHKVNIAYCNYVIVDNKKIFTNTKELRERYKDYERHSQKRSQSKYQRYSIPYNLVNDLLP